MLEKVTLVTKNTAEPKSPGNSTQNSHTEVLKIDLTENEKSSYTEVVTTGHTEE